MGTNPDATDAHLWWKLSGENIQKLLGCEYFSTLHVTYKIVIFIKKYCYIRVKKGEIFLFKASLTLILEILEISSQSWKFALDPPDFKQAN